MTQINQIYKCNVCGNIVTVLHAGSGELVCCGQPMELLVAKTKDEGQEKHVPVLEKTADGVDRTEMHAVRFVALQAGQRFEYEFVFFINTGDSMSFMPGDMKACLGQACGADVVGATGRHAAHTSRTYQRVKYQSFVFHNTYTFQVNNKGRISYSNCIRLIIYRN